MAVQTSWYREGRIIFQQISGDAVISDVVDSSEAINLMLHESAERVHVIVDITNLGAFPTSLSALSKSVNFLREPNLGLIVIVGINHIFIRFVVIVMSQAAGTELKTVNTMDEALIILGKIDPSLSVPA